MLNRLDKSILAFSLRIYFSSFYSSQKLKMDMGNRTPKRKGSICMHDIFKNLGILSVSNCTIAYSLVNVICLMLVHLPNKASSMLQKFGCSVFHADLFLFDNKCWQYKFTNTSLCCLYGN